MAALTIWDRADEFGNVRTRDVAAVVGVDIKTIYKFVYCGLLPARRLPISHRFVFHAEEVEKFIAEMRV